MNDYLICDHCKMLTLIKPEDYVTHLKKHHNVLLPPNTNLSDKLKKDSEWLLIFVYKSDNERQIAERDIWSWIKSEEDKKIEKEKKRQQAIDDNTYSVSIIWDDIIFGKNEIKFDTNRLGVILSAVPLKGVFESLNEIKKEYFKRLFAKKTYKLIIFQGQVQIDRSPAWKSIIDTIEIVKVFYNYQHFPSEIHNLFKIFDSFSNGEIVTIFEKYFSKSRFLKYLAGRQSENYKIIPICEFINNHIEESFLFRLTTKRGSVLIVWENTNDSRATHIFHATKGEERNVLMGIEKFIIREDFASKRALLYSNDSLAKRIKEELQFVKSIKHKQLYEYETEIDWLIENI